MKPWFRLLTATVLLTIAPRLAGAAEPLEPGSWSAQFSVQPNFTLGSFSGTLLSLKRHYGGGHAIRFGVSFGISDRGDDQVSSFTNPSFGASQTSGEDGNTWSVGVNGSYFWYSGGDGPIRAFWGGGPFVGLSGNGSDRNTINSTSTPSTDSTTVTYDSDGWQVGLGGSLGVEWLVAKRVGLFAEYGASLSYLSFTEKRTATTTQGPTTDTSEHDFHRTEFGGAGARLGLSAYF
jgi:hypothetical protein